jgi:ribosomal protein S27E
VLNFDHKCPKTHRSFFRVRCDCGKVLVVFGSSLSSGLSKSCGCLRVELTRVRNRTHGKTNTFEYRAWRNMLNRCYNPNVPEFKFYGRRGILVCRRWRSSFENFLSDVGTAPPKTQLDRRNNEHGYGPANCRWTDKLTQANNTRSNRFIECFDQRLTASQWSREIGISPATLLYRIDAGWSPYRALTEPLNKNHGRNKRK